MTPHAWIAATLAVSLVAEAAAPAFVEQRRDWRRLLAHDLRNLLLGVINALLVATLLAGALVAVDSLAEQRGAGLLRLVSLPPWLAWAAGLLAFDCWMYWWHRLNHRVPLLWRLHRVHHSDTAMDASSGLRFHPGEILLSGAARLIVVPLLGLPSESVALYGAVALPVVLLHHANVWLPRWLDFGLFTSGLLVTPAMHRVHHSRVRDETNSNYSSVLAVWDRMFGTLRVRRDVEGVEFGLDEFRDVSAQTVAGMLTTPLSSSQDRTRNASETTAGPA